MSTTRPDRGPRQLWRACLAGQEPAESLTPRQRERLVSVLQERGWSLADIAEHTAMSTYTTARICHRLQLMRLERRQAG